MSKRLSQIGNIRALAIFLVVLGHSIILYSSSWDLYETSQDVPFLNWLKWLIDIPQMPLFSHCRVICSYLPTAGNGDLSIY